MLRVVTTGACGVSLRLRWSSTRFNSLIFRWLCSSLACEKSADIDVLSCAAHPLFQCPDGSLGVLSQRAFPDDGNAPARRKQGAVCSGIAFPVPRQLL